MAGVGKLLKQAQKMQKQMEQAQEKLAEHEIDVSAGGGAVKVKVNGQGHFLALELDPEFLKEDAALVSETVLEAVRDAATQAKAYSEEEMGKITNGMGLGGLM